MRNWKKRALSMLLTFCMVLSLLPTSVFAAIAPGANITDVALDIGTEGKFNVTAKWAGDTGNTTFTIAVLPDYGLTGVAESNAYAKLTTNNTQVENDMSSTGAGGAFSTYASGGPIYWATITKNISTDGDRTIEIPFSSFTQKNSKDGKTVALTTENVEAFIQSTGYTATVTGTYPYKVLVYCTNTKTANWGDVSVAPPLNQDNSVLAADQSTLSFGWTDAVNKSIPLKISNGDTTTNYKEARLLETVKYTGNLDGNVAATITSGGIVIANNEEVSINITLKKNPSTLGYALAGDVIFSYQNNDTTGEIKTLVVSITTTDIPVSATGVTITVDKNASGTATTTITNGKTDQLYLLNLTDTWKFLERSDEAPQAMQGFPQGMTVGVDANYATISFDGDYWVADGGDTVAGIGSLTKTVTATVGDVDAGPYTGIFNLGWGENNNGTGGCIVVPVTVIVTDPTPATPLESVTISGTEKVDSKLTATVAPAGATAEYKWERCTSAAGANSTTIGDKSNTYTLVAADEGKFIKVTATGTSPYSGSVSDTTGAIADKDKIATTAAISSDSGVYTGTAHNPTANITVKTADGNTTLALTTDYTVTWTGVKSNNLTDVDTYTAAIALTSGAAATYSAPPETITYKITKAAAAAAPGLSSVDPTTVGGTGSVTITDYNAGTSYEYQKGSGGWTNWPSGAELSGTGITADTYKVRVKYDAANQEPSAEATATLSDPSDGSVSVVLTLDGSAYTSQTVTLGSASGTALDDSTTGGTYTASGVTPGEYSIWVNTKDTGEKVTVAAGATATANIAYFTVTATAGTGALTAQVDGEATAVVQSGKTAALTATAKTGYGDTGVTWTLTPSSTSSESSGSITVNDTVEATASYAANDLTFAPQTLTAGTYKTAYNANVTAAANGSGNYTYTLVGISGTDYPSWLSLSTAGAFIGTPDALADATTFSVKVDDITTGATATATYTLTIGQATPTVKTAPTYQAANWTGDALDIAKLVTTNAEVNGVGTDASTKLGGVWTVKVAGNLTVGTKNYVFTFTPTNTGYEAVDANVSIMAVTKTYTISTTPTTLDFGKVKANYTPEDKTFKINNSGNQDATLTYSFSGGASTKYALTDNVAALTANTESGNITVTPNANLPIGVYNETLTITNTKDSKNTTATVTLKFEVEAADKPNLTGGDATPTSDNKMTSADVKFTSSIAGTYYYVAQIGGTAPTAPQIKDNPTGSGSTAAANAETTFTAASLTADSDYRIYVIVDNAGTLSDVLTIAHKTWYEATITVNLNSSASATPGTPTISGITLTLKTTGVYTAVLDQDVTYTVVLDSANVATIDHAVSTTVEYFTLTVTDGEGSKDAAIDTTTTGDYLKGTNVTVKATAETGYTGNAIWTLGDNVSKVSGNVVTVNSEVTATAAFAPRTIKYDGGELTFTVGTQDNSQTVGNASATGAAAADFTYKVTSGTLPTGLSITDDSDGAISGTPTVANPAGVKIEVTVKDTKTNVTKVAEWTIKVNKTALPALTAGTPTDATTIGGSEGGVTFTNFAAGTAGNILVLDANATVEVVSKPAGATSISIDPATGAVTGLIAGTYTFRAKADANGSYTDSATTEVTIADGNLFGGKVTILADGAENSKVTAVDFVGNGATVNANKGANGVWTATGLDKTKLPYKVKVTVDGKSHTDMATIGTAAAGTVDAGTVNFYIVHIGAVELPTGSTKTAPTIVDNDATGYTDGSIVPAGTDVTFKLKDDATVMSSFDYAIDIWGGSASGSDATATVKYDGVKADVTASLKRNTYTVTGLAGTGIDTLSIAGVALDGAAVSAISGEVTTAGTANGAKFEGVPAGTYAISATLKPENIISGAGASANPLNGVGVSSGSLDDKFNYPTTGNTYTIEISEDATITTGSEDTYTYGYTTITTRTVSIKNDGNSDLANFDVTMDNSTNFELGNITNLTTEGALAAGTTATVTVKILASQNATDANGYTTTLTVKGNKLTSTAKTYTYKAVVNKATPAAPTLGTPVKPTTIGGSDGKLTITVYSDANTYEITGNGGTSWADIPAADITSVGVVSGLAAGTYQVRIKSDANHNDGTASNEATVPAGTNYAGQVTVLVDGEVSSKIVSVAFKTAGGASVPATGVDGVYTTAAKALDTANGAYTVYVTVSRNGANVELEISGSTVNGGGATATATAVDFYSVNFDAKATIVNKGTGTLTSATAPAVTAAITGGGSALLSGDVVLAGSTVDFTVASYAGHDYAPAWNQSISDTADTVSKPYARKVGTVTPTLTQKTYTVAGTITEDGGSLTSVTMTGTGADAQGTFTTGTSNGCTISGTAITMTVPKGSYEISAVKGSETAILGWTVGGASVPDGTTPAISVSDSNGTFGVSIQGASYKFTITGNGAGITDEYTYGDTTLTKRTITITNTGNSDLTTFSVTPSDTTNFDYDTDALVALNGTLAVGADVDIGVTLKTGRDAKLSGYETTFTVSAAKISDNVTKTSDYTATMAKQEINSAAITGVATPGNGVADASSLAGVPTGSTGVLTWSPALDNNKFAAGTVYTATVTLTPDSNHTYPDSATGTIGGEATTDDSATDGVLTLEYTFAPTKPNLTATIAGTAWDTANATLTSTQGTGTTTEIKYLVKKSGEPAPSASDVATTGIAANGTVNLSSLDPDTAYVVYAVAQTTATTGSVVSGWTDLVTSVAGSTWYKVLLSYDGHTESAPTFTAGGTQKSKGDIISVKQGTASVALSAAAKLGHWKLDTTPWVADPAVGTVPTIGGGTYTAPATGKGTAGVITLTAKFVGAELSVTSKYGTAGTYGAAYTTGTAPEVKNGSGSYTFTLIDPVTKAAQNGLPAGLTLNANGTITGTPEAVGEYAFAVKVLDTTTGATATTANVTLTVSAATPQLKTGYADGTYYNGNPVDADLLTTGTFTAPNAKSTAKAQVLTNGTWAEGEIAGTWSITDSKTTYGGGENAVTGTYNYTVKFVPTDAKYAETTGSVNIASIKKTYGVTLVLTSTNPDPFTKDYGNVDKSEVATFTTTNKGNQSNTMSYAISGTDAGKFTLSKASSGALASNGTDTVTLTVNDTVLAVGSYEVTLTATDSKGNENAVDVTFVVAPAKITTAGVADLTAPAKGDKPDTAVTPTGPSTANFTTAVKWTDKDGNEIKDPATYAAGSEYTVVVTLTADENYTFTNDGTYTIAGVTPAVTVNDAGTPGNTVVLTYKYPATAAGAITVAAEALGYISNAETIRITKLEAVSGVAVDFYYVVTTTDTPPTAEQVMKATAPNMVTGASGSMKNSVSGGTKAAWTGDERISANIAAGTPYYVYAIAVPAGATEASGTVGNKSLTTYYEVTMAAGANGSVSPAAAMVLHIEPLKSTSISATADPGYKFNGWTSSAGGSFGDASKPSTTFTPTANTTVTAAFSGISDLKVTAGSATGGNEVGDNYDDAPNTPDGINVFPGGELTNQGGGATGTLGYRVVAEGGAFGDTEIDTFTVDFTADTLAAGAATAFTVHPAAGLTTDAGRPKTYTATIWIYDTTHDAARDPITVSITIVDSKGLIVNPADYEYDLKAGVNNPEWKIDVAEGEFNTHVSLKHGATTLNLGTDYTYTAADKKGVLVISKTYLDNLRTTNNPAEGDTATLTLTMKTTGSSTATKALTIRYKDTTPYLTGVSIAPNADIRENSVLTATVNTSNLAGTVNGVTYQWYKTTGSKANPATDAKVGTNSATYTVQKDDVGAKFYVVVTGNGIDYKKLPVVTSALTESGKYTVTLAVNPAGGGAVSPITSYVTPGESITILAGQASGYDFVNWTVEAGAGTLADATANSTTYTPNKTSTVTANFKLLPTLTIAGSPYDATTGTGTLPSLTYTKNAGAYSKATIKGPGLDRDMLAADFTANALPTAAGGTYELARTFVNGLSAGAYTITFVDSTAAYSRSVILNVQRSTQALTSVAISGTVKLGQTLTATVAPGGATANYEWYFNSTPSNTGGTKITGADTAIYALPADGVVNGGDANLSGMYIYVKAIGTINYTGTVVSLVTTKLDVAKYTITVTANGPGKIEVNSSNDWKVTETVNDAPYNVSIAIQARPDDSNVFVEWKVTGGKGVLGDATQASTTFKPIGGNVTVTAHFAAKQIDSLTVTGIDVPQKGGTPDLGCNPSGTPDYSYGAVTWNPGNLEDGKFKPSTSATATITVTPAPGVSLKPGAIVTVPGASSSAIVDNNDGTWTITIVYPATASDGGGTGGGGGGGETTAFIVTYDLRDLGTTKDKTTESVVSGKKPAAVPAVTANKGLTFKGWSLENPAKVAEPKLVDPKTHTVKADTTFYAVYDGHIIAEHEHYIKGLPDGNFGPAQEITRAEVATIIARACLDGFEEGKNYGDDSYSDVSGHWAESAIAYCSLKGVFRGTDLGTFQPDRPITRQEFSLVFARLAGLKRSGDMPFTDIGTADDWAMDGIYTAYSNGWVIGYGDGTFKPQNNIARSEAVKIVDAYLNRGVNKDGVKTVIQDVKQWPDVPETYWAYYEIMEASNDHTCYYADEKKPPEVWTKAYIEKASWGE